MKAGDRIYWTKQREKALLKLGKKADRGLKNKDWAYARECLPKESAILQDKNNDQLRKTYSRILKASQGLCAYASCQNYIEENHRYCNEHRKMYSLKSQIYVDEKRRINF